MADNVSVYESKYTAEQLEHAINAVPHIGENGNWWVGDIDTGVRANSVDVTGCQVGNCIVVKGIDADGTPTAWEPASKRNLGRGKIVTIVNHTFTEDINAEDDWGIEDALLGGRHVWFNDADGNPLKLKKIWFAFYYGADQKAALTQHSGVLLARYSNDPWYGYGWSIGDDTSYWCSLGSVGNNTADNQCFHGSINYDDVSMCAMRGASDQYYMSLGSTIHAPFAFHQRAAKWDYADLVKLFLQGTMKAGTKIEIYGEMIE